MNRIKFFNGKIITPKGIIPNGSVLVTGDVITEISDRHIEAPDAMEIDVKGRYVSPGFIDIHIHGGGGSDFMDCDLDGFLRIAETHARHGTTAMMPTTLSCGQEELYTTLDLYSKAHERNNKGAQFVGMHIEGPYFALNQRGAQDARYIRDPDPREYEALLAHTDVIKRWSAAPERPGAIPFAKYLKSKNILPALAHTDAIYEEVLTGFEAGYTLATHLYSGMSGVTRRNAYRYAGAVESAFLIDDMDVEIIADGKHLPPALLKLIMKIKGPDRIALITDAMRAAGTDDRESILGSKTNGLKVIVEDEVAKLPDRTSFAGSVATADRLVRTMIDEAGTSLENAVKMMTATPARILGLQDRKGSISSGKNADLLVFDERITIAMTMVMGNIIYERKN